MSKQSKIIGIIGGMGPFASAYFYKLLLKKSSDNYGAKNNEDFPEILIDSVPVPDFISDTSKMSRAKEILVDRVNKMSNFGVGCLGMVCNTAHILYDELSKISKADFYSMINLVAKETKRQNLKRVCVLATPTTIKFDLYGKELSGLGIKVFYPEDGMLDLYEVVIREMVSGKKVEENIKKLVILTTRFIQKNRIDGLILGCTELPLVFPKDKFTSVIDCMDVLADKLLEKYYN